MFSRDTEHSHVLNYTNWLSDVAMYKTESHNSVSEGDNRSEDINAVMMCNGFPSATQRYGTTFPIDILGFMAWVTQQSVWVTARWWRNHHHIPTNYFQCVRSSYYELFDRLYEQICWIILVRRCLINRQVSIELFELIQCYIHVCHLTALQFDRQTGLGDKNLSI